MRRRAATSLFILCLLIGALSAPALAVENCESVFSDWVGSGKTIAAGGCYVDVTVINGSGIHAHVRSPEYPEDEVNIPAGNAYYYYNVLRVYVAAVNSTYNSALVEVARASASSAPTSGTRLYCYTPGQEALGGDVVSFPIVIQNNDRGDRTYKLSSFSDIGWKTWFKLDDKSIFMVTVPASGSKTVDLMVQT